MYTPVILNLVMTLTLDFQGQNLNNCISGMTGPIDDWSNEKEVNRSVVEPTM